MKFELDESLSPSLAATFAAAGHEARSVAPGGQPDDRVIDACSREQRVLVTSDVDFSSIAAYPPAQYSGIVVLRVPDQAHVTVEAAVRRMLALLPHEPVVGALWIIEDQRILIRR